ncbi:MAG TPA: phosphate ABC transporter substrate-binding protein [Sedimentibacter sp.]|nr:phosphate ABC transporter substrate-binding protein [Sedimentibacter sp.]
MNCKIRKQMKATVMAAQLLVFMILISACSRNNEVGVIVAGSTSVQPYAEVLAEEYMILNPGTEIDIQGGGSSAGITAATNGTSDIGMSSRELKDKEKSLNSIEIAKDGLVVIVNPKNPIQDLTLDQVRDIYSASITEWNKLGGTDSKIHVITREEGSGTRSAFEELLMGESEITPKAIVQDSNGSVRLLVADDPNSIGFISMGIVDETVKALSLEGVTATRESILDGSYTLSRPFLFVTLNEPTGQTKHFIDFVLSDEGQKLLSHEGLVPSMNK